MLTRKSAVLLDSAGNAVTEGGRTTISVNPLAPLTASQGDASLAVTGYAATLTHEGDHGYSQRRFGMLYSNTNRNWGEKRASAAEALIFKGLRKDAPSGIWSRSRGIDADAIERQADDSTFFYCRSTKEC